MSLLNEYITPEPEQDEPVADESTDRPMNTLASLVTLYEQVSEEAFTVGDINNWLQRRAARISAVVQDSLRTLTTIDFKQPEVLNIGALTRALNTRQFTELSELSVYVPVGFTGELKDYCNLLLNKSLGLATGALVDVVLPSQKCLAYYVNNPGDTMEQRELIQAPKITPADVAAIKQQETQYFVPGNRRSTALLGSVFHNKGAVVVTADILNRVNQQAWRQANPARVEAEVEKLVTLSNSLFGQLQGTDNNTSAEFLKNLMQQLREVGEYLEWYATFHTRLADFTAAMKINEKNLLDLQD